jgi:iron(III) transport system ATP-binding protein
MNILEINELSKSYDGKTFVVNDVDISLKSSRICAIVGESGSGKTTLLRLIAGLERPDNGTIKIDGNLVSSIGNVVDPQKRGVGMVFQDLALFPHLTVEENIRYGLIENKIDNVEKLLELIGLSGYNDRYPHELSGGEQQRIALARTLASDPKLLLLDEPFSSLDATLRSFLRKEVQKIVKKINMSMIFITHDLQDAIDIADDVIFLKDGKIIESGTLNEVLLNSKKEYVRSIVTNLKSSSMQMLKLMKY